MKIRNKIIVLVSSVLISGLILYSCKRTAVENLGPEYYSAPADFVVSNYNVTNNIDFVASACSISAAFNHKVSYTITIKGQTSGAEKTYVSIGDKIDVDALGGIWNGGHDGASFFRKDENVSVTLSFLGTDFTDTKIVKIFKARNFITGANILAVGGLNNGYEVASENGYPTQFSIGSGHANCTDNSVLPLDAKRENTYPLLEGKYYYRVLGKSLDAGGYFVGGIQHRTPSGQGYILPAAWTDPTQIYYNIYVYGTGDGVTTLLMEFHESDLSSESSKPRNECGLTGGNCATIAKNMHNPCSDDAWVYQYPITHIGWKLISVKYSDFPVSISATNGGSGDKIKEPTRVTRLQLGVLAQPPFKSVTAIWDFPVLTYGAPFDPSK